MSMEAGTSPQSMDGNTGTVTTPIAVNVAQDEAVAAGTNAYWVGHRALLAAVGTVFLSFDGVHALLDRVVNRGIQVETDAQRAAADLRRRTADAAHAVQSGAFTRSTAAISSGLSFVLNKLPGVSIAYRTADKAGDPAASENAQMFTAQVAIND